MAKLKCLISMQPITDRPELWYSNGYNQNVKFFYDLLELMGHEPTFIAPGDVPGEQFVVKEKRYRCINQQKVVDDMLHCDIAFEGGVTINADMRDFLRGAFGTRIVSVRYGIGLLMDMEQLVHAETMSPGIHVSGADVVWTSPHIAYGLPYLRTLYRCPSGISPYIWEPDFITRRFLANGKPRVRDIYVMEPNISVIKNSLIPMAIIEQVYRSDPGSFGKAMILNGMHFYQRRYFLDNIARHLSCMPAERNKIYFTPRARFDEAFQQPDLLLGHQWGCDLNYLYLEALYAGVPLVHNSDSLREVGYYYPDFDVDAGRDQCLRALRDYRVEQAMPQNLAQVRRYSIHNPEVQQEYARLIEQVLDTPL